MSLGKRVVFITLHDLEKEWIPRKVMKIFDRSKNSRQLANGMCKGRMHLEIFLRQSEAPGVRWERMSVGEGVAPTFGE